MLKTLHLENYRCFKKATIKFEPLTVLVGPNSSGKSSLLSALQPNPAQPFRYENVWQHQHNISWEVLQSFSDGDRGHFRMEANGTWRALAGKRFQYQLLHLDINAMRQTNLVARAPQLAGDGGNLSNACATLTRDQQADVAAQLGALVPSFRDVAVQPTSEGHHQLRFQDRWKRSLWYSPYEVSDGTMLVTAYVLLQHQDPAVDLIAIEEPERGIHPYLLGELVNMWRKMSRGEIGPRPVQIVLATHSAELLDHVEPSEVRFLRRDSSTGEVVVEEAPANTEGWREAYRTYQDSLGSMWLSGGLGGVPGA